MRNCDGSAHELEGPQFDCAPDLHQCPWTFYSASDIAFVEAWRLYASLGVLPYGGANVDEEPEFVAEAFALCAEAFAFEQERRTAQTQADLIGQLAEVLLKARG